MGDKLFIVHESQAIPRELWERFAAKARAEGETVSTVLGRLLRAYVEQQRRPAREG